MPVNKSEYPANWDELAMAIKEAAGWKCAKCGRQCIRPGQDTSGLSKSERGKYTLTVAHYPDMTKSNISPENLHPWCAGCHLSADREYHLKNAAKTRQAKRMAGTVPFNFTSSQNSEDNK